MFPLEKIVLMAIACGVTVASAAEPRFLFGNTGVQMFAGGSIQGHGGNSLSGGSGGGSYSGNNGGRGRPAGNTGSPMGNGGWSSNSGNIAGGSRPAVNNGGGSHSIGSGGGSSPGGVAGGNLGGGFSAGQSGGYQDESFPPKPYNFSYAVKDRQSGVNFGHSERSDGENVRGQYHVLLPDGRTQIVTYTANWRTGYNADVRYLGEARYPQQSSNSGFGWQSLGNEKPGSGNREQFGNNLDGNSISQSSGNGQSSSGYGRAMGNSGSHSRGPRPGNGPPAPPSGYGM